MKFLFRLGVLVLIAVLVAFPAISMQAQTADKQCFGLAAGDCDLLYSAFSADSIAQYTKGVTVDYVLDIKVVAEQPVDVSIKGKAQGGGTGDSAAFSTDLTASTTANDQEMSIPLSLRVLNSKLYINSVMVTQGKWQYLPLTMATSMTSQLEDSPMGAATDPEKQEAFLKIVNTPGVVTPTVAEQTAADGTAVKQFTFALDAAKLVEAPDFRPFIEEAMESNASASDVDLDTALPKIAAALKDTTFNLSFQVGTDKLLRGFTLKLVSKIDEATIKELEELGAGTDSSMEGGVDLDMTLQIDLSKIGTEPVVAEPEDAEELDLSGLFGGMGGSN